MTFLWLIFFLRQWLRYFSFLSSSVTWSLESKPKKSHFAATKKIIWYLKGTINVGLWYTKEGNFIPIEFLDPDFAGGKLTKRTPQELLRGTDHLDSLWFELILFQVSKSYTGFTFIIGKTF